MSAGRGRGFFEAIGICFSKYAVFRGRAPRSEYWWFSCFYFLVTAALGMMLIPHFMRDISEMQSGGALPRASAAEITIGSLYDLFALAMFLPTLAVSIRRLHDRDKSGWWWFIGLVPVVGPIMLLVWFCQRGTAGDNRFGPDPLAAF